MYRESLFTRIFDKYENYIMAFMLFFSLMILLIIIWALMTTLGVWGENLIIALVGFSGSILGGAVTLIGVMVANKNSRKIEEERRELEKINRFMDSYYDIYAALEKAKNLAINVMSVTSDISTNQEQAYAFKLIEYQDELLEAFRDTHRYIQDAGFAKSLIENMRDYNRLYVMGFYNDKKDNEFRERQESIIRAAITHIDKSLYQLIEKKRKYEK
ncbi:phage holin family protein [Alkalicoccobacillus murimartini]|uniref:Uncharacterized protein n=1 Tax=Alkalicoccobacillus murimartini TaxID=171685 RepID=A0ABT9YML8_9BACI|nr:phage holin family protein [Alkalicoccobacillus murimartini]MDQ0208884.1 hypothetical protein [Alkalicoccobacillus murimartini]